MPTGVPIQPVPNQSLSINLDGNLYDVTIKRTHGVMAVSFTLNGADIIDNARAVACGPIIPAKYLEQGNFLFLTANQQLPDYRQFGTSQSLVYLTASELATLRTPPVAASRYVPTVTVNSFNPIASTPLRFQPVGYVAA